MAEPSHDEALVPLVCGNLLVESVVRLLATSPLYLFKLPFWLIQGRAELKRRVAQAVVLPPETLALNPAVTREIAAARASGREVWLTSAANEKMVAPLAAALGAAGCIASDGRTNLVGRARAALLVKRFGEGGFDYLGNGRRDLPIRKQARGTIGVNLSARRARKVGALDDDARFLPGLGGRARTWLLALRPLHWTKNMLVFLPLVMAHESAMGLYWLAAGVGAALSAVASGTYLWNDVLDLPHDRRHPTKRYRPLAAGKLPLLSAIGTGAALSAGGLALAFWQSAGVGLCLLFYLIATLAYSLYFKRRPFIDVVVLAMLHAVRVLAGAVAVSVVLSPWLLAFSIFIFLLLAIVKRQTELHARRAASSPASGGRAYIAEDSVALLALGAASGIASVVVLALYIQSPEVSEHYARPECLWLISLLLLYWLGRMTLLANRGAVDDDPVVFAARDPTSWLTGIAILALFVVAL